jgi:hypothetical protein
VSNDKLLRAFDDTIWMAIRYAHGRHTYAPSMVRDAIKAVQEVYPDWKPRPDATLEQDKSRMGGLESDYLDDLVNGNEPLAKIKKEDDK